MPKQSRKGSGNMSWNVGVTCIKSSMLKKKGLNHSPTTTTTAASTAANHVVQLSSPTVPSRRKAFVDLDNSRSRDRSEPPAPRCSATNAAR